MKSFRIIPKLDIKGPNLVKGIHLEGLRVLGRPEDFARYYYENGADELIYQDVVASLYGRNSLSEMISNTAKENFIPLTVGGGIRTINDIKEVLRAGADKVCINSAAIADPDIIRQASRMFGSSTIIAGIEAIKHSDGTYRAYYNNGREESGLEIKDWSVRLAELGAGEILVTSIDQEGTAEGFDIELMRIVSTAVNIPVIAHGGAGRKEDVTNVIKNGLCDAVAIAGMFHYAGLKAIGKFEGNANVEGNFEFVKSNNQAKAYKDAVTISELKRYLNEMKISCRI